MCVRELWTVLATLYACFLLLDQHITVNMDFSLATLNQMFAEISKYAKSKV
jgi:hypothetical protein